ncbi:MAG TPA: lamin tail domain-containing protein, partial [Paludibacter sp.]|nr:lamin tail domain-containing protein [Paludibacter sp.]
MKKTLRIKLFAITALAAFGFSFSSAQIRITEVMSQSGTGGTEDWFELTNFGTTSVDITGWKMDDNSFDY